MTPKQLGHLFRDTRVEGNLSLREVAGWLGVPVVELGEYERGVRSPKSWRAMFRHLARKIRSKALDDGFTDGQTYDPCGGP